MIFVVNVDKIYLAALCLTGDHHLLQVTPTIDKEKLKIIDVEMS